MAERLELVLLGIVVEGTIGRKSQFLRPRGQRHPDVQDGQLRPRRAGDVDGVVERPTRGRREVSGDEYAAPWVHVSLITGHFHDRL